MTRPSKGRRRARDSSGSPRTAHVITGRPRGEPVTELGRWLAASGLSAPEFAARIAALAKLRRIPPMYLLKPKSLGDVISGRYCPGVVVLLLIRTVTDGKVDLQHWAAEILSRS